MAGSEAIAPNAGDWPDQGSTAPPPLPTQSTLAKRPIVLLIHGTFANSTQCETADANPVRTNGGGASQNGCEEQAAPGFVADDGKAWWRIGSKVWRSFQNELIPEGLALAGDKEALGIEPGSLGADGHLKSHLEPFQWPGANTERARHKAGQMLLDRLLHLEEEGRDYHLIGHSHGGSVIWLALQKAILYRWRRSGEMSELCRLRHLRSWSTIGTAFPGVWCALARHLVLRG